jgi:hypothetical protein
LKQSSKSAANKNGKILKNGSRIATFTETKLKENGAPYNKSEVVEITVP